jgi:hypothetical protein
MRAGEQSANIYGLTAPTQIGRREETNQATTALFLFPHSVITMQSQT